MTALRLDKLSLTNFRYFAHCEVEFQPDLTVLVAENGSGKTAVLDAAAAALSALVNAIYPPENVRRMERSDVRLTPGAHHDPLRSDPIRSATHSSRRDREVEEHRQDLR